MRISGTLSKQRRYRGELGSGGWCLWRVGKIFAGKVMWKWTWMAEREAHLTMFWELEDMVCKQPSLILSCIAKVWLISRIVLRAFQRIHQEVGGWYRFSVTLPLLCLHLDSAKRPWYGHPFLSSSAKWVVYLLKFNLTGTLVSKKMVA